MPFHRLNVAPDVDVQLVQLVPRNGKSAGTQRSVFNTLILIALNDSDFDLPGGRERQRGVFRPLTHGRSPLAKNPEFKGRWHERRSGDSAWSRNVGVIGVRIVTGIVTKRFPSSLTTRLKFRPGMF